MSITTARDVINEAFDMMGILGEGETASANQAASALRSLNIMLDSWGSSSLMTTTEVQESFTLVAGNGDYSIGSGLTFDTTKPIRVVSAFLRDTGNIDYPINIIPKNVYDSLAIKATLTSRPTDLYYDPGIAQQTTQSGTIKLYPIPDASTTYTLKLSSEKPFVAFSNLDSLYTFTSGYQMLLIVGLVKVLGPKFGYAINPDLKELFEDAKRIVQSVNSENKKMYALSDLVGTSHSGFFRRNFNIYSGGY